MKKLFTIMAILFAFTYIAQAQEQKLPTLEPSLQYQFLRHNPNVNQPNFRFDRTTDSSGFNVGLTGYVSPVVGLTAEVGANFDGGRFDSSLVTAMGGLTLKANRDGRVQPFVRGVLGVARERAANEQLNFNFDRSDSGLSFATGAGLDFRVAKRAKLRFTADYLQTRLFNDVQHNARLGVGIAY